MALIVCQSVGVQRRRAIGMGQSWGGGSPEVASLVWDGQRQRRLDTTGNAAAIVTSTSYRRDPPPTNNTSVAMFSRSVALLVSAGAMMAQLPALLLQAQAPGLQASWGWQANTAKCSYRGEGAACEGGAVLAGSTCSVAFTDGAKTPSKSTVPCPEATMGTRRP